MFPRNGFRVFLALLWLAIPPAASQTAVPTATLYVSYGGDPASISTLSVTKVGVLPRWTPPAGCDTATISHSGTWTTSITSVRHVSFYTFGCGVGPRASCCPPNWAKDGFYDPGEAPVGYTLTHDSSMSIDMGATKAWFACPT